MTRPMAFTHGHTCDEHVPDQVPFMDLVTQHWQNPPFLDATWGKGSIWKGTPWMPDERLDSRPLPGVTCVGDFRHMPAEWTNRFGMLLFDPPYVTESGRTGRWTQPFGTLEPGVQHSLNIAHLFPPFLAEAHRVLRPRGILLVKVMDMVHRGRMQYQVADFVMAVRATKGLTECDRRIKVEQRASHLDNWQGKVVRHSRTNYVYWIVVKKGPC